MEQNVVRFRFHLEVDLRALRAADPVLLLNLRLRDIVERPKPLKKLIGIGGNTEHPLLFHALLDRAAATIANSAGRFFVRETDLIFGTPVDRHGRLVGQSLFKELQEHPLRPLVVARIGGVDLAAPIKRKAEGLELAPEGIGVLFGGHLGTDAGFQGIVLRRKPEGVPADGIEHVIPLHAPLAAHNVHGGIRTHVADVKPLPRRVWKFNEGVPLLAPPLGPGDTGFFPGFLPLGFDALWVVLFHGWSIIST